MRDRARPLGMAVAALAVLQVPSARALSRYVAPASNVAVIVFLAVVFALYVALIDERLRERLRPLLRSPWTTLILATAFVLVCYFGYPRADALRLQMRGSDADD